MSYGLGSENADLPSYIVLTSFGSGRKDDQPLYDRLWGVGVRTIYSQGALTETNYGRDHHPRCFTMLLAGAGIQPGLTYGTTDDYSYNIVTPDQKVHVHDLNATILHLMGIDHLRLTFPYQGRDFRLTDVHGNVVKDLLA